MKTIVIPLILKKLEQMIKEENVKALIFCNPHNPVGRVWTREEIGKSRRNLFKIQRNLDG